MLFRVAFFGADLFYSIIQRVFAAKKAVAFDRILLSLVSCLTCSSSSRIRRCSGVIGSQYLPDLSFQHHIVLANDIQPFDLDGYHDKSEQW